MIYTHDLETKNPLLFSFGFRAKILVLLILFLVEGYKEQSTHCMFTLGKPQKKKFLH